jgi:hypothetical protein
MMAASRVGIVPIVNFPSKKAFKINPRAADEVLRFLNVALQQTCQRSAT